MQLIPRSSQPWRAQLRSYPACTQVQLPLPSHIDEEAIIEQFDPQKDVDGFHPINMGACVWQQEGRVTGGSQAVHCLTRVHVLTVTAVAVAADC